MTATTAAVDAARIAARAADRLKAEDIVAFDVSEPLVFTDVMLVAGAGNERQVLGVAREIERDLYTKGGGREPRSREGLAEAQWVLLDYGDLIVHVMHRDSRGFYGLERLWRDCPQVDLQLPESDGGAQDAPGQDDSDLASAGETVADGE